MQTVLVHSIRELYIGTYYDHFIKHLKTSYFRRLLGQQSKLMRFEGNLFIPLFATERLFPSVGNLELKLYFNSSEFCLIGATDKPLPDVKLQLERLDLKYKRVELSEGSLDGVNKTLSTEGRLLYPIIDYEVQNYVFYKDTRFRTSADTVLPGWPRRMFVFFVRSTNFSG